MFKCVPSDKKELFKVLIQDEEFEIHSSIFGKSPQLPPDCPDWKRAFAEHEYRCAKAYTLKKLSRKSYLSQEIQKDLKKRLVSTATIQKIIQECVDSGFLSDQTNIQSYIDSQKRKGYGAKNILLKLFKKGIDPQKAAGFLNDAKDEALDIEQAKALVSRKCRVNKKIEYQKLFHFLLRRGFSASVCKEALKMDTSDNF